LKKGSVVIQGTDSQPVSALLIAAAFAEGPIDITIENPGEKPWVQLTLNWFDRLGITYQGTYQLPGLARYKSFNYTVPGDLSSAAFPLAAALVTQSELTLKNIDMEDMQGDKELIFVLQTMGAKIEIEGTTLHIKKSSLKGIKVDINDFVDSLPVLSVIACFAEGETHIYNAAICRHKECDRIHSIATELTKMGADIQELPDGLIIRPSRLKAAALYSHHDHRIAMALTVAALGSDGESSISEVECISKTFPDFKEDFNYLGAGIL
ncbi:MAG: 3-phosphoshikimate 1-carboxyvinyltransferase, partial [Chlamydiota bacterium]